MPDYWEYVVAAYSVWGAVFAVYVVWLLRRSRAVRRQWDALQGREGKAPGQRA